MSTDRQTIIETNRSLRNIKNQLESLLEKGVIDDAVFETITTALPPESSLSGPLRTATSNGATPARNVASSALAAVPSNPPTKAFENLDIRTHSLAPPSYEQTPPPAMPDRSTKPIIAQARALYRYAASDARDLSFEKDDGIMVHEYMNADWWMGQNERTGQEGIFPRNYVLIEHENKAPVIQPQYGYPGATHGPPAQQNPYNSHVAPMAIAEGGHPSGGQHGDSKMNQTGKKFGKKLGNAAIFGAGATIGSNIVNSIF